MKGRARKAFAAAGTAFLTTLGASLWQGAAGSGLTSDEIAGSVALAVGAALATGLATFRVPNAGQIDVASLTPSQRDDVALLLGQKPAAGPGAGGRLA